MRSARWPLIAVLTVAACKPPDSHYRDIDAGPDDTAGDGEAGDAGNPVGMCSPHGFSVSSVLTTDTGPFSIAVADLNHDTWPDLVVANRAGSVSVLLNRGGKFPTVRNYATGHAPQAVIVANLDADDWPDLIVANSGDTSVGVLLNTGMPVPGSFKDMKPYSISGSPSSMAVVDFGTDQLKVMVTAMNAGGKLSVFLENGDGTFFPMNDITMAAGGGPAAVAAADLNGGARDLVIANRDASSLTVLLGKDQGGFDAHTERSVGTGQVAIAVADLDRQHNDDIIVANHTTGSVTSAVTVMLNDGTGAFPSPGKRTYATGANPQSLALADLNDDQLTDLVVANHDDDSVSVLLGAPGGTFLDKIDFKTGGTGPQSVAVADVNHDGFPDIVVANNTSNTVTVLLACPR